MYIIYKHTNKINNKCYIGQTIHSLKSRCGNNGSGYKRCTKFYRAILKYSWDNFTHEIIMSNLNKIEADFWEKYYISFYDSIDKGYNIETGGRIEGNQYKRKIYQYDLNGNFIKHYTNYSDMENDGYKYNSNLLYDKTFHGYYWSNVYLGKNIINIKDIIGIKTKAVKIYQYSLNGNYIKCYNSIKEVINEFGKSANSLLNPKTKISCGYQWRRNFEGYKICDINTSKYKKIAQYDLNHNLLNIYNNMTEAYKSLGLDCKHSYIAQCCQHKKKRIP